MPAEDRDTHATATTTRDEPSKPGRGLRLVRYLTWGPMAFLGNMGLCIVLYDVLHLAAEAAIALALVIMTTVNFVGLRYFVYRAHGGAMPSQLAAYAVAIIAFRALEYAGFLVTHSWLSLEYHAAVVGVLTASFAGKYLVFNRLVFVSPAQPPERD